MSFDDLPLKVQFPELNSFQIAKIRELLKREYERGKAEIPITVSEPTPMNYFPNVDKDKTT